LLIKTRLVSSTTRGCASVNIIFVYLRGFSFTRRRNKSETTERSLRRPTIATLVFTNELRKVVTPISTHVFINTVQRYVKSILLYVVDCTDYRWNRRWSFQTFRICGIENYVFSYRNRSTHIATAWRFRAEKPIFKCAHENVYRDVRSKNKIHSFEHGKCLMYFFWVPSPGVDWVVHSLMGKISGRPYNKEKGTLVRFLCLT